MMLIKKRIERNSGNLKRLQIKNSQLAVLEDKVEHMSQKIEHKTKKKVVTEF